jgi:hypothetical protein
MLRVKTIAKTPNAQLAVWGKRRCRPAETIVQICKFFARPNSTGSPACAKLPDVICNQRQYAIFKEVELLKQIRNMSYHFTEITWTYKTVRIKSFEDRNPYLYRNI